MLPGVQEMQGSCDSCVFGKMEKPMENKTEDKADKT